MNLIRRLVRFFLLLFVALLLVAGIVVLWVGREIGGMESAVWDRSALDEVKPRKEFLQRVAADGILPKSLKGRARGLLGDLAYHQSDYETANHCYESSMELVGKDPRKAVELGVKGLIPSAVGGFNDFARGYNDYQVSAPTPLPIDDSDLVSSPSSVSVGADWSAFTSIPPLDEDGIALLRETMREPAEGRVSNLCSRYWDRIQSLLKLRGPLVPPDFDDFEAMIPAGDWMRLLILDALSHANVGKSAMAVAAMDAAFNQAAVFERNPRIASLIMAHGLREEVVTLLESGAGRHLRSFFRVDYCMPEQIWNQSVKGEYQAVKRLMASAMPGDEPVAARLRTKVLIRHVRFWRGVLATGASGDSKDSASVSLAQWFFKNRRYFIRPDGASYADGRRVAAESEDLVADLVYHVGALNLGNLRESIAGLRIRETALASASR